MPGSQTPTTEPCSKPATLDSAPSMISESPSSTGPTGVFDLNAAPSTLPRDVRIYLSALGGSAPNDDAVARGLVLLRTRRAEGAGPLYPFLPKGLDADELDAMLAYDCPLGPDGEPMLCTNVRLPIPAEFEHVPAALYESLVVWLYSTNTPMSTAARVARYEEDEFGMFDFDRPLDMDAEYSDEWIMRNIVQVITEQVRLFQEWYPRVDKYAWAATAQPLL